MEEEIYAYFKYILNFCVVKKPTMPKFDVSAYTDNEYVSAISSLIDFERIDEDSLTLNYLKGE